MPKPNQKIVGFNYRLEDDPLKENAGTWKVFATVDEAMSWTKQRTEKTDTSPRGISIYWELDHIREDYKKPGTCISLKKAIKSYLDYIKQLADEKAI